MRHHYTPGAHAHLKRSAHLEPCLCLFKAVLGQMAFPMLTAPLLDAVVTPWKHREVPPVLRRVVRHNHAHQRTKLGRRFRARKVQLRKVVDMPLNIVHAFAWKAHRELATLWGQHLVLSKPALQSQAQRRRKKPKQPTIPLQL
jgi:hypothetical protein